MTFKYVIAFFVIQHTVIDIASSCPFKCKQNSGHYVANIKVYKGLSKSQCEKKCCEYNGCKSFSYYTTALRVKTCDLKSSTWDDVQPRYTLGVVSCQKCPFTCKQNSGHYVANIQQFTGISKSQCEKKCCEHNGCKSLSHYTESSVTKCDLKSIPWDAVQPNYTLGVVSCQMSSAVTLSSIIVPVVVGLISLCVCMLL